ncbi:MAG: efflux RND transporter periplasmic adaptor subunit [Bacteroidota bacterium]
MNKFLSTILSATILLGISCKEKKEVAKEENTKFVLSDSMAKMIAVDTVGSGYIQDELTLSGEVSFNENNVNKIYPRNSGQVIESKVTLGDKVSAGQVLAIVKSADVAGNYADLSSANADINIAKRQMDNTENLYKNGIASEKEYTEAKQNYEKTLAVKNKIQSLITINGGNNSNSGGTYSIVSPIDGYIVEKKLNAGNFIRSDMGDYLFTVSDLKNVWVNANVFEADISKVKAGYAVKVTTLAYPDKFFNGTIDKVSEVLDPSSKTMKARIRLDNSERLLRPEMFAKVVVTNKENKVAITIPTKALISLNGKSYVVIYNSASDMNIAEVNILKSAGEKTYINSGVTEGQKIITHNQLLVFQQLLNE